MTTTTTTETTTTTTETGGTGSGIAAAAGAYTNVTATTVGVPAVVAGQAKVFLDIRNLFGTTASVSIIITGTSTIIDILEPGGSYTREGNFIPSDALSVVSSAGTALVSVGAF